MFQQHTDEFEAVQFVLVSTFNRVWGQFYSLIWCCRRMIWETFESNFLLRHKLTRTVGNNREHEKMSMKFVVYMHVVIKIGFYDVGKFSWSFCTGMSRFLMFLWGGKVLSMLNNFLRWFVCQFIKFLVMLFKRCLNIIFLIFVCQLKI
jgi:hypothetical protein